MPSRHGRSRRQRPGGPEGTRTPDLRFRKALLYPAELPGRAPSRLASFDAERKFQVPNLKIADPKSCQCGEVLKGVIKPWQCKVFGGACTPETPLGALMVSSEGACAAYYNYGGTHLAERRHAPRPGIAG